MALAALAFAGCAGEVQLNEPGEVASLVTAKSAWSDPATWGGRVPGAGEDVVIPRDATIVLDTDTPALGRIRVEGRLEFARRDLSLTADSMTVMGSLAIGSAEEPFAERATITLTGAVSDEDTARGIMVHGGALQLHGRQRLPSWTVLNHNAEPGANWLLLASPVRSWQRDDHLVVAPTDFYGVAPSEEVNASAVFGRAVALQGPVQHGHWGRLQYVTRDGMALSPDPELQTPAEGVPSVLDERGEVGNLTRNIVIQGADDAAWQQQGFGAHVMVMGANSSVWIEGVELRRVGQAGRTGRYPIHFHLLSYDSAGKELAGAGDRTVRGNAIWNSANRCVTIHATNDVTLEGNVCYDIKGHAVFLEDAVERRNVIRDNLVLKVRFPKPEDRLLHSDRAGDGTGSAGFWLTNPDNTVTGNHVADSEGNGFWLSFPPAPLGLSKNVPIEPSHLPLAEFSDNTSHSNNQFNVQLDWVPVDDEGSVVPNHYEPTSDGRAPNGSNAVRFTLRRVSTWKGEGIWNRPVGADFVEWTAADNTGMYFMGGGYRGRIRRVLAVGESLNNASTWRERNSGAPPTAFASYHSEYNMQDNILVNFPIYPGPELRANGGSQVSHGGMLETKDYYITPVDLGTVQIRNNLLINSHPGFRVAKPDKQGAHWTLAGALWDPHGLWGPQDHYWVYDMPFLTHGTSCSAVEPAGENGMSCAGPYYGLHDFSGNDASLRPNGRFLYTLDVRRQDERGQEIDAWLVRDGRTGDGFFDMMRHAPLVKGGRFDIQFSEDVGGREVPYVPSGDLAFNLTNLKRDDDEVLVGVPFSGSEPAGAYVSSHHIPDQMPGDASQLRELRPASSLAEVQAGGGDVYWQDRGGNRVWIKVRTPSRRDPSFDPDSVDLGTLHRGTWVRVYSCGFVTHSPRNGNDAAHALCQ